MAAPLSHNLSYKRDTGLELLANRDGGVEHDSLLRLALAQPFHKIDLEGPVGI